MSAFAQNIRVKWYIRTLTLRNTSFCSLREKKSLHCMCVSRNRSVASNCVPLETVIHECEGLVLFVEFLGSWLCFMLSRWGTVLNWDVRSCILASFCAGFFFLIKFVDSDKLFVTRLRLCTLKGLFYNFYLTVACAFLFEQQLELTHRKLSNQMISLLYAYSLCRSLCQATVY